MSAAEWHRWLVRLAVEAGADIDQAHERMAQAACVIALTQPADDQHGSGCYCPSCIVKRARARRARNPQQVERDEYAAEEHARVCREAASW